MKQLARITLIIATLLAVVTVPSYSSAVVPDTAPLVENATPADGMIRVWLSSIRGNSTYNLTVSGTYSLNGSRLPTGTKVKVEFSGGTVYTTVNGNRVAMGSSATLKRESGGVKISESLASGNVYPGDMRFLYSGGTAYVVCYLYIEDYIYGVLPYEMDNSFPLEALKAQAVAARTYGMRAKTSSGVYDVTDTTTHQVFRGVNYSKTRCIQAVDDSWNVVMQFNGSYAGAYYSASNGGQTEASNHVWGGSPVKYLTIQEDPFDLANTRSVKKSYMIYASPQNGSSISAYSMVRAALASKLGGTADSYTIVGIDDVQLHSPMYAAPSRLYTKIQVTVRYNGGNSTTVDIPIFPTVENMLGLGINSMNNELYTVEKEANGFRITARRYGHGAGMSQRGAEQMGEMGYSYGQIIGFYYPGAVRARMNLTTNWTSASPTPPPVNDTAGIVAEKQATVALTNPNDSLNLRAEAGETSKILGKIPNGSSVTVLSDAGDWWKVRYGTTAGYIAKKYLSMQSSPAATPAPGISAEDTAIVRLNSGSLNLRSSPEAKSQVIGGIPNGASVYVMEKGTNWTRVRYNNQIGYAQTSYLAFATATSTAKPVSVQQKAYVNLADTSETLNLRMGPYITAPILALLRHGVEMTVKEKDTEWSKVTAMGMDGYVMNRYISFANTDGGSSVLPTQAPQYTSPPVQQATHAVVTLSSGNLNLRVQPNATAEVINRIPNGATVQITQVGDHWDEVKYLGATGYVMNRYLLVARGNANSAQSAPSATSQPNDAKAWIVTRDGDRVNLRQSASSTGTILTKVAYGEEVAILETGSVWSLVKYQGKIGYIATDYLASQSVSMVAAAPTASPQNSSNASAAAGSAWIISRDGGSVSLRKSESKTSDSIALMPYGTEITLLNVGKDWCKVIYRGLTGYVMGDFLTFVSPTAQQAAANSIANPVAEVSSGQARSIIIGNKKTVLNSGKVALNSPTATLHLVSEPNELSTWAGKLSQGQAVEVLQYDIGDARWLYIRSNGVEGYALMDNIRLDNRIAEVILSDPSTALSVRSSASGNADSIASLTHGALITVTGSQSDWAKIRLEDGMTGYVYGSYIRYF